MVVVLRAAEGPRPAGALPEGDPASPSAHHDHDEDGALSSGKSIQRLQTLEPRRLCRYSVSPSTIQLTRNRSSLLSRFTQTAAGFTIPVGHQVCVSPTVNHRLYDTWDERMEFKPDRYLGENPAAGEKFAYVPFGAGRREQKNIFLLSRTQNTWLALANAAFSF